RVPVGRIDPAEKWQPLLVEPRAEGLDHERRPLRTEGMADEAHARLGRRPSALQPVAPVTGADDVLPGRRATLRARDDVVEVQLGTRESPATVLAAVVVARVDVEATEADVAPGHPVVTKQQYDAWHPDRPVDQADALLMGSEIGPAGKVERPVLLVD